MDLACGGYVLFRGGITVKQVIKNLKDSGYIIIPPVLDPIAKAKSLGTEFFQGEDGTWVWVWAEQMAEYGFKSKLLAASHCITTLKKTHLHLFRS